MIPFATPFFNAASASGGGGGGSGHRYWRVNITALGGGTTAAIVELEMYENKWGPNACTGGTATASSQIIAADNYDAGEAFDYSLADFGTSSSDISAWAGTGVTEWLKYDFGAGNLKNIVAIGMHGRQTSFKDQTPTTFDVQYSDDNSTWTTAWSVTGLSWSAHEFKRLVNPSYSVPSYSGSPHGSHSYWRVAINNESVNAIAITELELRATSGGSDQANGGTAAASSIYSGSFPASQGFDNNTSTFWHCGSGQGYAWLRYDFASPVSVAEISIRARNTGSPTAGPEYIAVQYADNPSGPWTTAWMPAFQTGWTLSEVRTFADPNYV